MNDAFRASLDAVLQQIASIAPRFAAAVIILVVAVIIGRLVGRSLARLLERGHLTRTHQLFFRNLTLWFFILLGIGLALNVLGLNAALASFVAGSGVAAIVLGFAFREIGENLLAGLFLAFSRPFNVGDFILSEELEGEVREIQLRYTHIRTADGRDIYIPNSQIFNKPLTNFTRDGLRRAAFTVGIDYADDAEAAGRLIQQAIATVANVLKDPEPMVIVASLAPQYVDLEVSFWINTFRLGTDKTSYVRIAQKEALARTRSDVMEAVRSTLIGHGFTVSANVTTSVALDTPGELGVRLAH